MESIGRSVETKYLFGTAGEMAVGKTHTVRQLQMVARSRGIRFSAVNVDNIRRDLLLHDNRPETIQLRKDIIQILSLPICPDASGISGDVLGNSIFFDDRKMEQYKRIIRPLLSERIQYGLKYGQEISALDWALLIEDEFLPFVNNNVLLIICNRNEQMKRLQNADLPEEQLKARLKLHLNTEQKLSHIPKDHVIIFDTSIPKRNNTYEELLDEVMEKFRI